MATTLDYINFVCEQINSPYPVGFKKMFGEYMVYVNQKPILLVCDNTVFVKKLPEVKDLLQNAGTGFPYSGAKEHYVLDIEDGELVAEVVDLLERVTPAKVKK